MAVTKTHPIKSTLKAAIDYICNPEKTDGKLLVSSYGCTAETADIEFSWTRRHAIDKGTNLGRHLIQAFQPGEVTPKQAHEIGMELAKEILGGKYEFVLTTHIDKDHVHNHLIFNTVSFADHKHYHSNKRSYHYIRRTSDRLCKEHGLSVIIPGQDKGKSYPVLSGETPLNWARLPPLTCTGVLHSLYPCTKGCTPVSYTHLGKSAAISRLSGFLPDNQTDNRLDNRSDNGLLFLLQPFLRKS